MIVCGAFFALAITVTYTVLYWMMDAKATAYNIDNMTATAITDTTVSAYSACLDPLNAAQMSQY